MSRGQPYSAKAISNLVKEARRDVTALTEMLKEKALQGHSKALVSRSDLNVYRRNKLESLGFILEDVSEEHIRIRGW